MSRIIDGKVISAAVKERVKKGVAELNEKGITVGLAVIIVGEDPASKIYVANKKKACESLGIISEEYALPESTTEEELLALVDELNRKKSINGILCQLPLPRHLDEKLIINSILPEKDVDAFHPANVGRIMIGDYDFVPCTPAGIMEMLAYENINPEGKSCVVIGRSNIVGKPMAMLLLHKNGTVTVCHSKTQNLKEICRVERVHVLFGENGVYHRRLVNMLWERQLHQDTVHLAVRVKLCNKLQQFLLGGLLGKSVLVGVEAYRFARLLLVVDIHS